jgi:hypothetical protein
VAFVAWGGETIGLTSQQGVSFERCIGLGGCNASGVCTSPYNPDVDSCDPLDYAWPEVLIKPLPGNGGPNGSPTEITLCPSTCDKVTDDAFAEVDVVLGCQTIVL